MNYFFYDLETSGLSARFDRIMQFAGQRTDMSLKPIGKPINVLIKLTSDVLPDPEAILINGITPQKTLSDGITEAEFLKLFYSQAVKEDTIFLGYNSIRFDDEFMRFLLYRNFYDAYQWQYANGCSRWDLLDVVRTMRALRPEGVKWPFNSSGAPTNKLEALTKINRIVHTDAHDALGDVKATISLAQLIRKKQPKLFDYLLSIRDKKKVAAIVLSNQPFVYSSSTYPDEFEKTTVVTSLGPLPNSQGSLVYDLRHDPTEFLKLSAAELVKRWPKWHDENPNQSLPVKTLKFNRCPAVAPLNVLDKLSQDRLQLDMETVNQNLDKLRKSKSFVENIFKALELLDKQKQIEWTSSEQSVDSQLYNGFFDEHDSSLLPTVRQSMPAELSGLTTELHDPRLKALLPLYKARNYPDSLTPEERSNWQLFCHQRLLLGDEDSRLSKYMTRLQELAKENKANSKAALLESLRLYGQSLKPGD